MLTFPEYTGWLDKIGEICSNTLKLRGMLQKCGGYRPFLSIPVPFESSLLFLSPSLSPPLPFFQFFRKFIISTSFKMYNSVMRGCTTLIAVGSRANISLLGLGPRACLASQAQPLSHISTPGFLSFKLSVGKNQCSLEGTMTLVLLSLWAWLF